MKTSIVILAHNQLDYTKLCIESIRRHTELDSYEIILIDNASSDGTKEWIMGQKDITSIFNDVNVGFPAGCNQGMAIATGDNILLLNNDTVVTKKWLDQLIIALYSDPKVGAVGCVTNNCSYGQRIPTVYTDLEQMHRFAEEYNVHDAAKWQERLKLIGFCFLIKTSVFKEIGYLDEIFTPGNYEDDDYSLRIRKAGYKLLLCRDTFIHHFGSVSFKAAKEDFGLLINVNMKKFEHKWGFNPDESQHVRHEIVNLISDPPESKLRVLEVGCACGGTLLEIKNRFKNSDLFGIERNNALAEVGALIADMCSGNVEEECLNYPEEFFDYIIFADVLDHLYDPWKALSNIRKHLKPSGKLLVSLSNIMHYSVLRELINGTWPYTTETMLEKAPMRFFTLQEINTMLIVSGFKMSMLTGTETSKNKDDQVFIEKLAGLGQPALKEQYNVQRFIFSSSKNELHDIIPTLINYKNDGQFVLNKLQNYNMQEIIKAIHVLIKDSISATELLNMLGVMFFENGVYQNVLPFFEAALEYEKQNKEVLFNLSYFLNFIGEVEIAKYYVELLEKVDKKAYLDLSEAIAQFR